MNVYRDVNIIKFGLYGFFKNLKFFEPFFILFLLSAGLSFFEIGILFLIKYIVVYIIEIPSGLIADLYGKKSTLIACFVFYIISFIGFYLSGHIIILIIAMIFFGLGEAFRSGTHKAIIVAYLDHIEKSSEKTRVYGFTRALSLVGSSLSGIIAVILILLHIDVRTIFLFTIIPYICDILLVLSYPAYVNEKSDMKKLNLHAEVKKTMLLVKKLSLLRIIYSSSMYDAVFESIKDYIQPVIHIIITGSAIVMLKYSNEMNVKIITGLFYSLIYIIAAISSYNAHRFLKIHKYSIISILSFLSAIVILATGVGLLADMIILVLIMYVFIYMIKNIRRPIMVDIIASESDRSRVATIMSGESQFKVLFAGIMAPIIGLLADHIGLIAVFVFSALIILSTMMRSNKYR